MENFPITEKFFNFISLFSILPIVGFVTFGTFVVTFKFSTTLRSASQTREVVGVFRKVSFARFFASHKFGTSQKRGIFSRSGIVFWFVGGVCFCTVLCFNAGSS